jgi:IclR family transcriptional regulator, pca regulon regulatory protein
LKRRAGDVLPRELEKAPPRNSDFVQSLERGLAVIRAFSEARQTLSPSDVAAATGLTRAAARRFLLTLAELGYVRADGRSFQLTPRVLELGRAYLSGLTLPDLALPHLREFVADVRESSSIGVLDGDDVVYAAHVSGSRILSVTVAVGSRDPASVTSLGRVLLAAQPDDWLDDYLQRVHLHPYTKHTITDPAALRNELQRIRRQGHALVDEEFEQGLRALSTPIHDDHGTVIAAANVALHTSRWTNTDIRTRLLPQLHHLTTLIEADVRATGIRAGLGTSGTTHLSR